MIAAARWAVPVRASDLRDPAARCAKALAAAPAQDAGCAMAAGEAGG